MLQDVAERVTVNQINTAIAQGDLATAKKLMAENPNLMRTKELSKYYGERDQWGKEFGLKEKETNASVALMGTRNEAARHALETQRQEYLRKEQERKAYETVYDTALKSRDNREKFNLGVQDLLKEDPTLANHIVQDSLGNIDYQQTFENMKALANQQDQIASLTPERLKAIEASIPLYTDPKTGLDWQSDRDALRGTGLGWHEKTQGKSEAERLKEWNAKVEEAKAKETAIEQEKLNQRITAERALGKSMVERLTQAAQKHGYDPTRNDTKEIELAIAKLREAGIGVPEIESAIKQVGNEDYLGKLRGGDKLKADSDAALKDAETKDFIKTSRFGLVPRDAEGEEAYLEKIMVSKATKGTGKYQELLTAITDLKNNGVIVDGKRVEVPVYVIGEALKVSDIDAWWTNPFNKASTNRITTYITETLLKDKDFMKEVENVEKIRKAYELKQSIYKNN